MNCGNNKRIVCTDTGEIFESIKDCSLRLGLDGSSITKVCKNKQSHTKGYHFMYEKDYVNNPIPTFKSLEHVRRIICLNDKRIYNSIREAGRVYNLDFSGISKVCRGKNRSIKGYRFAYIEDYEKQNL